MRNEKEAIKNFERNNNLDFIPESNRFFEIGQEVNIGNLKDCKIGKKLFGGFVIIIISRFLNLRSLYNDNRRTI